MTNNDVWSLESRKVRSHRDMTYFFSRMSKKGDAKTSISQKDRMLVRVLELEIISAYPPKYISVDLIKIAKKRVVIL